MTACMAGDRCYVVLTALGPDRPGLVQQLAEVIHGAGANLEDSRMAILGGEFALIVLLAGSDDSIRRVSDRFSAFESQVGLRVSLKPTTRPAPSADGLRFALRVDAEDRPGILAAVSAPLRRHGVNVASLESRVENAPLTGTPMFRIVADLHVPTRHAASELRADLEATCLAEGLDFALSETPS